MAAVVSPPGPPVSPPTPPPAPTAPQTPFWAWNRLESRPRKQDFSDVLKARIHDPLWMLGRQWQMGEFAGMDTGTGITAKAQIDYQKIDGIDRYGNGAPTPYALAKPLEPIIEAVSHEWSIKERILMGNRFHLELKKLVGWSPGITGPEYLSLIAALKAAPYPAGFRLDTSEPTIASPDTEAVAGAAIYSDDNLKNFIACTTLSGNVIDGAVVYEVLKTVNASTPATAIDPLLTPIIGPPASLGFTTYGGLKNGIVKYNSWVNRVYTIPTQNTENWVPSRLEYQFDTYWGNVSASPPDQLKLPVTEYHGGHFDWNAFVQNHTTYTPPGITASPTSSYFLEVIMSKNTFPGMPSSRWWEFEDGNVNFCKLDADKTDMAKVILTQFALIFQDDWFLIPSKLPMGTYSKVAGIVVTDVFGVKTYVPNYSSTPTAPTGTPPIITAFTETDDWKGWRWMDLSIKSDTVNTYRPAGALIVPPVTNGTLESKPFESVLFMKDEMADVVWGIEKIIPDNIGRGRDGTHAANMLTSYLKKLRNSAEETTSAPLDPTAKLTYSLGSGAIPENWIPLMPVHKPSPPNNRRVFFQRASMPRIIDQYDNSIVRPRTQILNYGLRTILAGSPLAVVNKVLFPQSFGFPLAPASYAPLYINEEEIPKEGTIVETSFQRTRWLNGKIISWVGRKKTTGSGEGNSGLTYDTVNTIA